MALAGNVADEQLARLRARLRAGPVDPVEVMAALRAVAPAARDAWVDRLLGLGPPPDDGPALPRGGVPYLPCPVEALLAIADHVPLGADDVVVDVGAGVGRAAALLHLLSGAEAIALEIQPELVRHAETLLADLPPLRLRMIEGDAVVTLADAPGTVFVLYCPFSGAILEAALGAIERHARTRELTVACVDLPLPPRPWLTPIAEPSAGVTIWRGRA